MCACVCAGHSWLQLQLLGSCDDTDSRRRTHTYTDRPWSPANTHTHIHLSVSREWWRNILFLLGISVFFVCFFFTPTDVFTVRLLVSFFLLLFLYTPTLYSSSHVRGKRRAVRGGKIKRRILFRGLLLLLPPSLLPRVTVNALISTKKANWISFNRSCPLGKLGMG